MLRAIIVLVAFLCVCVAIARAQDSVTSVSPEPSRAASDQGDPMRAIQSQAMANKASPVVHWGAHRDRYNGWDNHTNRLIPVYTFGLTLDAWRREGSAYRDPERLKKLYGRVPDRTVNPTAAYYDQTDIYRLQMAAVEAGYSNIILIVFDGMDWQTTRAASIYKTGKNYTSGRGHGLAFQDYRGMPTDFAYVVTSPLLSSAEVDVNSQTVLSAAKESTGGYDPSLGGDYPWHEKSDSEYLISLDREVPHSFTDSASSATSMTCGVKTFNASINFLPDGSQTIPIARTLQSEQDFKVGIVTNVPVSHATVASAYANNVSRKDYQDIGRDMIGLRSASHREEPLPGVDVLIGGGWGVELEKDANQGDNFLPGNKYLHQEDIRRVDLKQGGRYLVSQRKRGTKGGKRLLTAAQKAADENTRLLGFYGAMKGHLPYQTADGRFNPTVDISGQESYSQADVDENPSLAEMTRAALLVLEQSVEGFWLLVEAGDVDWANHSNNIDNSIGSVFSGEAAFKVVMEWIAENNAASYTAVIVTADHGHFLVIDDAQRIMEAGKQARQR